MTLTMSLTIVISIDIVNDQAKAVSNHLKMTSCCERLAVFNTVPHKLALHAPRKAASAGEILTVTDAVLHRAWEVPRTQCGLRREPLGVLSASAAVLSCI